jgi:site-specific DNA recombinase
MREREPGNGNEEAVRVVGYVRCSTEEQAASDFNTLESQKEFIARWVSLREPDGWSLARFYEDSGYSAASADRPALQQLMRDSGAGLLDVVVVYRLDRWSRSIRDFMNLEAELMEHGIQFASVKEQLDTTTPMGRAMRSITMVFAQLERETIAERIRDKMHAEAQRGRYMGGVLPLGYATNGEHQIVIVPEEAEVVRRCYDVFRRTRSHGAVLRFVRSLPPEKLRGERWGMPAVRRLLRRPIYAGHYVFGDTVCRDAFEPIIPPAEWEAITGLRPVPQRATGRATVRTYLLKGLVRCSCCGVLMSPFSVTHRNRPTKPYTPYYRCSRDAKRSATCTIREINAERAEAGVVKALRDIALSPAELAALVERIPDTDERSSELDREIKLLRTRADECAAKIARLTEAIENGGEAGALVSRIRKLEAELRDAKGEMMLLEAERTQRQRFKPDVSYLQEVLANFDHAWENLTDEERVLLLNSVIDYVEALSKKRLRVHLNLVREPESNTMLAVRDQMVHRQGLEPWTR